MWIYFLPITSAIVFLYVFLHMCIYIVRVELSAQKSLKCTKICPSIPSRPIPLLISLFFFASSNSATCAIADKLMVMNQRPCYRHVSCTGGANAVANIAPPPPPSAGEGENRLLLQDRFRHTLSSQLFYYYFIK
jgi:hypothetical protein